jgi:hypothetical protein
LRAEALTFDVLASSARNVRLQAANEGFGRAAAPDFAVSAMHVVLNDWRMAWNSPVANQSIAMFPVCT